MFVEDCRVPQVAVVLFPGVGVAIGGVAPLGPVGGTAGRPVAQDVRRRAVARDQYSSADRTNDGILLGMTR